MKSARADVICHKHRLFYNGRPFALTLKAEEVATMFAVLLDTVHVSKPVNMTVDCIFHILVLCIFDICTNDDMFFLCQVFRKNFWKEWRLLMTPEERGILVDLDRCDFRQIKKHLVEQARQRRERYKICS